MFCYCILTGAMRGFSADQIGQLCSTSNQGYHNLERKRPNFEHLNKTSNTAKISVKSFILFRKLNISHCSFNETLKTQPAASK